MANYKYRYESATVYTLTDPRDGEIRYVGCTADPLAARRSGHLTDVYAGNNPDCLKASWLLELVELGLKPEINAVEVVPFQGRDIYELFWIRHFKAKGCRLTNRRGMGDTFRKKPIPQVVLDREALAILQPASVSVKTLRDLPRT
jgi:hypothetical protein